MDTRAVSFPSFVSKPLGFTVPFTYRDGATYLEILEAIKTYITETLIPEVNQIFGDFKEHYDATEEKYRKDLADYIATVEARFAELAEAAAQVAVDAYLAEPSTLDNATASKINDEASAIRHALETLVNSLAGAMVEPVSQEVQAIKVDIANRVNTSLEGLSTALDGVDSTLSGRLSPESLDNAYAGKSTQTTVESGRLSPEVVKTTIQTTPVSPKTFIPRITIQNKIASAGYHYEVIIAHADGRPRPGIVGKMYAHDFHTNSPGGDQFIVPGGNGETMVSMAARSGADIVSSSCGWQTSTEVSNTYAMRGPQIKDGIIYRDFEPNSNRGRHALGVHEAGRIIPSRFEDGDTAQKMVDAGVVDAFGFGPLLTMNGVQQNVEALSWSSSLTDGRLSARTIFGVRSNYDVVIIEVTGNSGDSEGVGGNNMAALAASEGMVHSVLLDGGGSTQAVANGITFHPSSDADQVRELGEGLLLFGRARAHDSSMGVGAWPLELASGYVAQSDSYMPGAINRAGQVSLVGGVSPAGEGALFPANTWVVIGNVPDIARPKAQLGAGAIVPCSTGGDAAAKVQIRSYGEISIRGPSETGYANLHGASYAGL